MSAHLKTATQHALEFILVCMLSASGPASAIDSIVPDAQLQAAIAKIPAAQSAEALKTVLDELKASSNADYDKLVPQLLYFSAKGADVREGMTAGVVIDRLQISQEQMLRAITPYLDTKDPALGRELSNLLGAIDEVEGQQSRDFSLYSSLLQQERDCPPPVLVAHMLDSAPEAAIGVLANALLEDGDTSRALMVSAKSKTRKDVEQLSRSQHWWVRYYTVARMRRDPTVLTEDQVQRLRDDPHPTVRAAAANLAP